MPLSSDAPRDTKWAPSVTKIPGPKIYERKRMKAYYKEWLLEFLRACAAVLAIPAICLLLWIHWALFAAVIVAGLIWLTKPKASE